MANKDIPGMEVPPLTLNVLMVLSVSNNDGVTTPHIVRSTAGQPFSKLQLLLAWQPVTRGTHQN